MPREYRHIKQYEKEIVELREAGFTYREIGEQLGIEQIKIKQLEMENELMRDFLSLTERK